MTAVDDLKLRVAECRQALFDAEQELHDAQLDELGLHIGDIVTARRGWSTEPEKAIIRQVRPYERGATLIVSFAKKNGDWAKTTCWISHDDIIGDTQ